MGRRIDQVQSRRRRIKQARHMKVLYHHTDPMLNEGELLAFEQNQKKLKCIESLIDMQANIVKIVHNLVLTDDGRIFNLVSESFFDDN